MSDASSGEAVQRSPTPAVRQHAASQSQDDDPCAEIKQQYWGIADRDRRRRMVLEGRLNGGSGGHKKTPSPGTKMRSWFPAAALVCTRGEYP
ncbi:hypothetical protein ACOMHN_026254 [Nucella lapillus]